MSSHTTFPTYQAHSGWDALLPPRAARTQAPAERHFDAIVIGAGVTGLAAARRVAELEPQSRVLLVDANTIGNGSSGRNSGFLINLPHNTSMSGHGSALEVARKQIALYAEGLDWLKGLVDRHGIDCGWNPVGKYHAAATPGGVEYLRANLRQYSEWGIGFSELTRDELVHRLGTTHYRFGYHAENNVFVQPAVFVRGLADSLPPNVQLWEGEPVLALHPGEPVRVVTRTGEFTARRVIVANNGFARKLGLVRDRVLTIYTYAGFTEVLPPEELAKLGPEPEWGVIPANRLGTTLRKVGFGRFMVRSAYSYERERPMGDVKAMLEQSFRTRYPNLRSHDLPIVWGGVTALTRNGAVYFGQIDRGVYLSIGCNGAGMVKGSVFGKLLGEMACGAQSPQLADVLGFEKPSWLPPEPIRSVVVKSAIQYQKFKAGSER